MTGQMRTLITGGSLSQDEWIRTDRSGRADVRFLDDTQLAIGPESAVKLDRFTYAPGRQSFVLNAIKGLFTFSTGNMPKAAYRIQTPTAVLGVRGTRFS